MDDENRCIQLSSSFLQEKGNVATLCKKVFVALSQIEELKEWESLQKKAEQAINEIRAIDYN